MTRELVSGCKHMVSTIQLDTSRAVYIIYELSSCSLDRGSQVSTNREPMNNGSGTVVVEAVQVCVIGFKQSEKSSQQVASSLLGQEKM